MRAVIPNRLWIGNAVDLQDVAAVLSAGVEAVIDLAANEPAVAYPRDIAYCRLPLIDGAENNPTLLRLAVSTTSEFYRGEIPTLVACSAGMSRSPAVAATALALVERRSADDVLREIAATGSHDVAPLLWTQLRQLVNNLTD